MSLIDDLIELSQMIAKELPESALEKARLSLLDWMVCGWAGKNEPLAGKLRQLADQELGVGQSSIIGGGKGPARMAALVNGATSHALDYDDTHFAHVGHLSVGIYPAALAVADVGVAVGSGESVNVEAADVMVPGDDPRMLADLLKLARRTDRNFKQNLSFSILVTTTLVYAVVNGFYDALWVGVLVHELSVILVILNGARLAEGTGTLTLVKNTFQAMWEATQVAFTTGRKQLSEMRS